MSRKATESAPDDFVLAQDYATNFYAAEQYGADAEWLKAAQAWQRATPLARTEDEYFYCLLNEGRTWLRTNQGKNALGPLERALELRPDSTVAADLVKKARSVSRS